MSARKADAPLILDLPKPAADQPSWVKVGAIAAIGFVIGVAWPKLTGVRLGPAAPGESAPASSAPPRAVDAPPAAPAAPPPSVPANAVASAAGSAAPPVVTSGPPNVAVRPGVTLSCKTNDGESLKGKACGTFAFDSLALPRLKKLSQCQAADGAEGKLSTVFNVDFTNNKVDVFVGRSSTVGNLDTIAGCLRQSMEKVSLAPIEHEHARYQVAYSVQLSTKAPSTPAATGGGTPSGSPQSAKEETAAADAQVVWEVAIVRDTPRTGQVVARLQRGTKIRVGSTQEGWYRVKYGATFNDEGWVYRGAIGK